MANLIANGYLQASGDGCGCSAAGQDSATMRLGLRCTPAYYQSVVDTPVPLRVSTTGAPGDAFTEIDMLAGFVGIEFLAMRTDGTKMVLCIGAAPGEVTSDAMTLPTGFVGTEQLVFAVDGTIVTVAFQAGDQTLAQVVNRINAACALAGLPTPRCTAVGTTKIKLSGVVAVPNPVTPASASVDVTSTPAAIPFTTATGYAQGSLVEIQGLFVAEFPAYPDAPQRVEISGQGTVSLMAAGRTTA